PLNPPAAFGGPGMIGVEKGGPHPTVEAGHEKADPAPNCADRRDARTARENIWPDREPGLPAAAFRRAEVIWIEKATPDLTVEAAYEHASALRNRAYGGHADRRVEYVRADWEPLRPSAVSGAWVEEGTPNLAVEANREQARSALHGAERGD